MQTYIENKYCFRRVLRKILKNFTKQGLITGYEISPKSLTDYPACIIKTKIKHISEDYLYSSFSFFKSSSVLGDGVFRDKDKDKLARTEFVFNKTSPKMLDRALRLSLADKQNGLLLEEKAKKNFLKLVGYKGILYVRSATKVEDNVDGKDYIFGFENGIEVGVDVKTGIKGVLNGKKKDVVYFQLKQEYLGRDGVKKLKFDLVPDILEKANCLIGK